MTAAVPVGAVVCLRSLSAAAVELFACTQLGAAGASAKILALDGARFLFLVLEQTAPGDGDGVISSDKDRASIDVSTVRCQGAACCMLRLGENPDLPPRAQSILHLERMEERAGDPNAMQLVFTGVAEALVFRMGAAKVQRLSRLLQQHFARCIALHVDKGRLAPSASASMCALDFDRTITSKQCGRFPCTGKST